MDDLKELQDPLSSLDKLELMQSHLAKLWKFLRGPNTCCCVPGGSEMD